MASTGQTTTRPGGRDHLRRRREPFLSAVGNPAVGNTIGENTFHEAADDRDDRCSRPARQLTAGNPARTADLPSRLHGQGTSAAPQRPELPRM